MEIAAIIALALTYLAGIAWFSLAQWIAIELDGERRVGVSIRIVLAVVWPLTILIATCAVLARQVADHHSGGTPLSAGGSMDHNVTGAKTAPDHLIRVLTPKDAAR
jgi:heme/copper-type cytochrome/quinol oxidase subunit 2